MSRSLTFPYLFLLLAVSYLGGILLFRELSDSSLEKILVFLDARVVHGHDANWYTPVLSTVLFFVVIVICSRFTYSRFFALFIGALKCVLFGVSSAYLLAQGLKMYEYAIWWFPFQILICFSLLLFTFILAPPFFMKKIGKVERNNRALLLLLSFVGILLLVENLIYFSLIH